MATNNAVQLKIAPFWKKDPELWFVQLEKLFAIHKLTLDYTKFNHVVSVLDTDVLSSVRQIVISPPETNKYDTIKNAIIANFTESSTNRLSQLLTGMELGDQKPSQLLARMRQLATGVLDDEKTLKVLWIQKLHPTVRALLLAFPENTSLDAHARQADVSTEAIQVASVNAIETPSQHKPDAIAELSRQFEVLATEVRQMREKEKYRKRSPPRANNNGLCWYHEKYGRQARSCRSPCNFKPKN